MDDDLWCPFDNHQPAMVERHLDTPPDESLGAVGLGKSITLRVLNRVLGHFLVVENNLIEGHFIPVVRPLGIFLRIVTER